MSDEETGNADGHVMLNVSLSNLKEDHQREKELFLLFYFPGEMAEWQIGCARFVKDNLQTYKVASFTFEDEARAYWTKEIVGSHAH
jgi:hypothetical protein